MCLSIFLLDPRHVTVLDAQHNFTISKISVVDIDPSLIYYGKHHLPYAIFSMLALVLFIFLPSLFLILYPIRGFRSLLSKCHLDSIAMNIFADKLQISHRNGLDGGCDMRCFSGIFFNLRIAVFICIGVFHLIVNINGWIIVGIIFTMISLILTLTTPYQKTYMNIFDALLVFNLAILCFLFGSNISFTIITRLLLAAPIVFIVALILLRNLHQQLNSCWDQFKLCLSDVPHNVMQYETTTRSIHK